MKKQRNKRAVCNYCRQFFWYMAGTIVLVNYVNMHYMMKSSCGFGIVIPLELINQI